MAATSGRMMEKGNGSKNVMKIANVIHLLRTIKQKQEERNFSPLNKEA